MRKLSSRDAIVIGIALLILSGICRADQLHDVQAVSTDISDVLNALSLQSGRNVVVSSDVKGTITVQLKQVSFENALDYIVKMQGFGWRRSRTSRSARSRSRTKMTKRPSSPSPS